MGEFLSLNQRQQQLRFSNPLLVTHWKGIEQQQKQQEAKEGYPTLIMVARNEEEKFPCDMLHA